MSNEFNLTPQQERARAELSRKLNLLVDVVTDPDGSPFTYRALEGYLDYCNIKLSRARWIYMLSGMRYLVTDERLLAGIADFFEVDPAYLIGSDNEEIPASVEAALQFVRAERLGSVRLYAARKLGDVSPETLKKLTAILDEASASVEATKDEE